MSKQALFRDKNGHVQLNFGLRRSSHTSTNVTNLSDASDASAKISSGRGMRMKKDSNRVLEAREHCK